LAPPSDAVQTPGATPGVLRYGPADRLGNDDAFRLLVASVRDYAIFMLDRDGRVATWNAGAQQIKQYLADEIIGQHFSVFYPQEAIARGWPDDELRLARERGRLEDEGWRVRKDGSTFWANVIITPLYDEDGELQGYAKISRDMTERKRMEALESASRRITDLLAMLAHELRNPLAPMRNATAVMKQGGLDAERLEWCREVLDRQVSHLSRLVDDLLDVGRISSGKVALDLATVSVQAVLEHAAQDYASVLESHGHVLDLVLPDAPLWLRGDAARLHQVLLNLLDNAARYTPPGGTVRLTGEEEAGQAVIRVMDTGPGIPQALLPNIFDIFVQGERPLDRSVGGLGLGLAVVKHIVELHHGHVRAQSAGPGLGTHISLRLPLAPPPAQSIAPAAAAGKPPQAQQLRVLVVDDNLDSADSMAMLLSIDGYAVEQAYHGREALALFEKFQPDAVLLDIGLPEMNGYDVANRMRALPAGDKAVIIAMTGYGQSEDRRRSAAAGFTHHLVKPIPLDVLRDILAAIDPHREGGA
jgi:PAS domain S-box-containing protein